MNINIRLKDRTFSSQQWRYWFLVESAFVGGLLWVDFELEYGFEGSIIERLDREDEVLRADILDQKPIQFLL